MERRLLSPPEAALLISPGAQTAILCVQAGLLALVGAGRIQIEKGSRVSGPFLVLNTKAAGSVAIPDHLGALERTLLEYGKGRRLGSTQVIHALQRKFGYHYRKYIHECVALSLVKRGFLTRTDSKWLAIFPRIRYQLTARGEAMAAPLARLVTQLKRMPDLLSANPEQALRLARSAGVLLIMAPEARQNIEALRSLFAARGDALGVLAYVPLEDEKSSQWDSLLELGDMALTFEIGALLDAVGAIGDFSSGGDSSSSDGSGDGGGGD